MTDPFTLALNKNGTIVNLNTITPAQALSLDDNGWKRYVDQTRERILSKKTGGQLSYKDYLKLW